MPPPAIFAITSQRPSRFGRPGRRDGGIVMGAIVPCLSPHCTRRVSARQNAARKDTATKCALHPHQPLRGAAMTGRYAPVKEFIEAFKALRHAPRALWMVIFAFAFD